MDDVDTAQQKRVETLESHVGSLEVVQETMTKGAYATKATKQSTRAKEAVIVKSHSTFIRSNVRVRVENANNDDNAKPGCSYHGHTNRTPTGCRPGSLGGPSP